MNRHRPPGRSEHPPPSSRARLGPPGRPDRKRRTPPAALTPDSATARGRAHEQRRRTALRDARRRTRTLPIECRKENHTETPPQKPDNTPPHHHTRTRPEPTQTRTTGPATATTHGAAEGVSRTLNPDTPAADDAVGAGPTRGRADTGPDDCATTTANDTSGVPDSCTRNRAGARRGRRRRGRDADGSLSSGRAERSTADAPGVVRCRSSGNAADGDSACAGGAVSVRGLRVRWV